MENARSKTDITVTSVFGQNNFVSLTIIEDTIIILTAIDVKYILFYYYLLYFFIFKLSSYFKNNKQKFPPFSYLTTFKVKICK